MNRQCKFVYLCAKTMYKALIRPVLFLFSPEVVHHLVVKTLKISFKIPFLSKIIAGIYTPKNAIERTVFGLKFKNPVGLAAGFDKDARIYNEFSSFGFGFIEIGTVTPKPQPGNPKPRMFRLKSDQAIINRMGFNNLGVDEAVKRLKNRQTNVIIGGNIGKNTLTPIENAADDYAYCFDKLYDYVDYFVVNVSCPNITGLHKLQDEEELIKILDKLVVLRSNKKMRKPILLKIAPDLNTKQLNEVITIVNKSKIEGIVATNTTITRDNLSISENEIQSIGNGGLSGKPLTKKSTEVIRYISEKTGGTIPIIGVGGIMSASDALEKLEAGASLVQIYTGFIYEGPALPKKICKELSKGAK